MTDRAQLSSSHARPIAMFLIGLTVIGLVGREIVAAQRAALAQCAPDCQLGAPLFEIHAQPTFLDAALSNPWPFVHHATALAAIALLTWIGSYLFTFAKWPEADGDE